MSHNLKEIRWLCIQLKSMKQVAGQLSNKDFINDLEMSRKDFESTFEHHFSKVTEFSQILPNYLAVRFLYRTVYTELRSLRNHG